MKKLKKFVIILTTIFAVSGAWISPLEAFASEGNYTTGQTRADIIEWRYKTENGKVYKRQFNYSKNEWIGDWIFVANVVQGEGSQNIKSHKPRLRPVKYIFKLFKVKEFQHCHHG